MIRSRTQPELEKLAAFAGWLKAPGSASGAWAPSRGKGTIEEPYQFPSYDFSGLGAAFFDMAYDAGWVIADFDWVTWKATEEAQGFLSNVAAIGAADSVQLAKLITTITRQDRYCDGTLAWAFETGLLTAMATRA